jgi:hypothetical protein
LSFLVGKAPVKPAFSVFAEVPGIEEDETLGQGAFPTGVSASGERNILEELNKAQDVAATLPEHVPLFAKRDVEPEIVEPAVVEPPKLFSGQDLPVQPVLPKLEVAGDAMDFLSSILEGGADMTTQTENFREQNAADVNHSGFTGESPPMEMSDFPVFGDLSPEGQGAERDESDEDNIPSIDEES